MAKHREFSEMIMNPHTIEAEDIAQYSLYASGVTDNKMFSQLCELIVAHSLQVPSPPEAEPVVSAEEILRKEFNKVGFNIVAPFEDGFRVNINVAISAMEEYASLRVAQEKAELIEKLEILLNREDAGKAIYSADGIQEAIDLIKNR